MKKKYTTFKNKGFAEERAHAGRLALCDGKRGMDWVHCQPMVPPCNCAWPWRRAELVAVGGDCCGLRISHRLGNLVPSVKKKKKKRLRALVLINVSRT